MRNNRIIFVSAFVLLFAGDFTSFGQISAPAADYVKKISYRSYSGNDSVFVFHNFEEENTLGELIARSPFGGTSNFEWRAYDRVADAFGPVFRSDSNTDQSVAGSLDEGGYQVTVSNGGGEDTTFLAWVFIDDFEVYVEQTADGRLEPSKYTCDLLTLNGFIDPDTFYYYDPNTHEAIRLLNGIDFLWTSDNPDLIIPNANKVLNPNTTYRPPYEDTWYILTAVDSFGMEVDDSVFYESIHVKSEFSMEFFDKEDTQEYVEAPFPTEGGAPLKVRFTNLSRNGYSYEWIFDDSARIDTSTIYTEDINYRPEITYKQPGYYYPSLLAKSEEGCPDISVVENPIDVLPSQLDIPNVFTPNGDEINRYFKVKHLSIKEFHIRIYSRTGNMVYKADGTDLYSWEGWDGTVLNTSRPAPNGAYYYVIEATGYDEKRYNRGPYKGVVYLFR